MKERISKNINRNIKNYWREFKNAYDISSIIKGSLITVIILSIVDNFNIVTQVIQSKMMLSIAISIFIYILILTLVDLKLISMSKIGIINDIDMAVVYLLATSFLYELISSGIYFNRNYKVIIPIIVFISGLAILLYRMVVIGEKYNVVDRKSNIYDLKDLYEGNIHESDNIIFINEEEVDYDLLSRGTIINNLYDTLINCNPSKKFVIGLEGKWGSGKTTIINIVTKMIKENNEDIIVIKDFDPWAYNDQCSMFRGMFDAILRESNLRYSITKTGRYIDEMYNLLFEDQYIGKLKILNILGRSKEVQIVKIKEMINNYLRVNNKKIVFIIDNIDRAIPENVELIFKLVNNIFDFNYITYVLSYDDLRVKAILDNFNIDYEYLKKVIQLQIRVPETYSDVKEEVINKCVSNLLILYGENKNEINKYEILIKTISTFIIDIRDLKRFLNSIISFAYKSHKYLNTVDIIVIEFIKNYNNKLYKSIMDNKEYFISNDKEYCIEAYERIFDYEKFNVDGKDYFDKLFNELENKDYLGILALIFPYVKNYKDSKKLESEGTVYYDRFDERKSITRENSICSAKFFDLYFNNSVNEFIYINRVLNQWIVKINNGEDIKKLTVGLINTFSENLHKVLFETMEYYIDDVNADKLSQLTVTLFANLDTIDDSTIFLGINARGRAIFIITKLLSQISDEEFNSFLNNSKNSYNRIYDIYLIAKYIDDDYKVSSNIIKDRARRINELLRLMAKEIYDESIDIYKSTNYKRGNIWGIYYALEDEDRDIKEYVNKILNSDNSIKFLFDIIGVSKGDTFNYYINKESLEKLCSEKVIDTVIACKKQYTEDEEFILSIYKAFKEGKINTFGNAEIVCDNERKLKLS